MRGLSRGESFPTVPISRGLLGSHTRFVSVPGKRPSTKAPAHPSVRVRQGARGTQHSPERLAGLCCGPTGMQTGPPADSHLANPSVGLQWPQPPTLIRPPRQLTKADHSLPSRHGQFEAFFCFAFFLLFLHSDLNSVIFRSFLVLNKFT